MTIESQTPRRLDELLSSAVNSAPVDGGWYSRFIKSMRIVLPIMALVLAVLVFTWDDAGQRVKPLAKEDIAPQSPTVQNELIKPVFQSVDDKNQPFVVSADRATQDKTNPDLLTLDKPQAEITMLDGAVIKAQAQTGLYEQNSRRLTLNTAVTIDHSDGYRLISEELRVDVVTEKILSGRDVTITGPAGTLEAKGLDGDSKTGRLIFTGPARVVLTGAGNLSGFGE
jgi:lipopolysaccharide export system protein LptC